MQRYLTFTVAVLCLGAALNAAHAQQNPGAQASPNDTPRVDDEIVVTRKRLSTLHKEVELAQEDMYKAFNANNSDHELDIHCYREVPINSHISRRVCRPVFVDSATSRAGQDFTASILDLCLFPATGCPLEEGSSGIGGLAAQDAYGNLKHMAKRLDDAMERLIRENPDVAKAAAAYQAKQRAYQEALGRRRK